MRRALAIVLLAFASTFGRVEAQEPGSELTVYLLTMDPGDHTWELFGHNAIWIHDERAGTDIDYNWGVFNFNAPGFYTNFLRGLLIYEMAGEEMGFTLYKYQQFNRSLHAQQLNLTPAQRKVVQEHIRWNQLPENFRYRYHYYKDNCSTRVRDVIDRALNGELRRALEAKPSGQTYRTETQRLTYHNVPLYTGLMIAMGPMLDEPLSAWEDAFIPMQLQEWVRTVAVKGPDGATQPLVVNERTLFKADRPPVPAPIAPKALLPYYIAAGLALGALFALLGSLRARSGRIAFAILVGVFSFVVGLVGTIMEGLWLFTDHDVTYHNENILQANTLSLVLVVALIAVSSGRARADKTLMRVALTIAGLSTLGFLIQVFPMIDQANGESIALLMPAHIAIAWVLSSRVLLFGVSPRVPRTAVSPPP